MALVQVNGVQLAYDESGAGDPAFLFIHGGAADARAWAPQFADLARDHRCIALNLRGCGDSAAGGPYSVQQAADDAAEVLVALGAAPAVVVGHSLGGIVALRLNQLYPSLVLGLVLADSPIRAEGLDLADFADVIRTAASVASLADRFVHDETPPDVGGVIRDMAASANAGAVADLLASASTGSDEMLALVKAADQKPFMTLWPVAEEETAEDAAESRGGDPLWLRDVAMFVRQEPIAGAGHYLQLEHPAITSALLRAFVDDVRRDPRIDSLRKGAG